MFTVLCRFCPEPFTDSRISEAMAARRHHEEMYHRLPPVESDMSADNK